jgi:hypothetical protein
MLRASKTATNWKMDWLSEKLLSLVILDFSNEDEMLRNLVC